MKDAVFLGWRNASGPVTTLAILQLSDDPWLCNDWNRGNTGKNETLLTFYEMRSGPSMAAALKPGEYTLGGEADGGLPSSSGGTAFAVAARPCQKTAEVGTGRLTIEAPVGSVASGTFDVTFGGTQTERVVGAFRASFCEYSPIDTLGYSTCN